LKQRIKNIIKDIDNLKLQDDCKIIWQNKKIAELKPGKNYLNPIIKLIIDDTLDESEYDELKNNIEEWLIKQKHTYLKDLLSIENTEFKNSFSRGLSYQLFENNGVLKREISNEIIKNLSQNERFELRKKGIKIGKYHIYQPRMIRPNAVKFKTILWRCFNNIHNLNYPNFGINFAKNFKNKNESFLRICGFETFGKYIIRIDILERLFLEILARSKDYKFKFDSKIINLLGCNKDDFMQFVKLLGYKPIRKNDELEFQYIPKKIKQDKKKVYQNAFSVLENFKI